MKRNLIALICLVLVIFLVIGLLTIGRRDAGTAVPDQAPQALECADSASLATDSPTPTITGAYSGDYGVSILIATGTRPLPKKTASLAGDDADNGWVFDGSHGIISIDWSDHGGSVDIDQAGDSPSGRFSYTVGQPLAPGAYVVGAYVFHNIYGSEPDYGGYRGDSPAVLTTTCSLTVRPSHA